MFTSRPLDSIFSRQNTIVVQYYPFFCSYFVVCGPYLSVVFGLVKLVVPLGPGYLGVVDQLGLHPLLLGQGLRNSRVLLGLGLT